MILKGRTALAVLVALAASLALNFVGIGYLSALMTREHRPPPPPMAFGLKPFPPEIRERLLVEMRAPDSGIHAAFAAAKAAREKTFAIMRADPLDEAALAAAFAGERAAVSAMIAEGQRNLTDIVKTMPASVRAKIGIGGNRMPDELPDGPPDGGPGGPPPGEAPPP
ncbi:periplasmic heavy metal sensor [Segnochrobactrum spirostomi]|uniref:Periplasmic heavy metal sensor n=1 Tax=Segnochrobactrum spirostomi TaxID=2608987 RepID=A0A6A7Y4E2_9HYPH|nr:periplasmic heavy metal sensor [Segnochrobactrum spirostomi]MQT12991.1 periplasmic heavy metal sensor [Segnochrobactrum spirostomi]